MTEYEIADLALSREFYLQDLVSLMFTVLSSRGDLAQQFMTVLFAYITAAYFIGARLDRRQMWIFSTLYVFWQCWTLTALYIRNTTIRGLFDEYHSLADENESGAELILTTLQAGSLTLLIAALLASLLFMWSVRHPKAG